LVRYRRHLSYTLRFTSERLGQHSFDGLDLYECLILLRGFLLDQGWRILCHGARLDVSPPSAMSRQMGGGAVIQLKNSWDQQRGRPVLLNAFAEANSEQIGTIDEQREQLTAYVQRSRRHRSP
jgi:hypothetical protein